MDEKPPYVRGTVRLTPGGPTTVCYDSRAASPGSIFVAIRGRRWDGHDYIQDALEKGALGAIVDRAAIDRVPAAIRPFVVAAVPNPRLTLAYLARDFYRGPSDHLFTIGITGTNGKTTVASLVEHIWNGCSVPPRAGKCGFIGTTGVRTGLREYPPRLTTPEAPDIQEALAEMRRAGMAAAVMEVSSQGIRHHRIDGIRFDVVALTRITPDHLDIHPSFVEYRDTKLRFVGRQPPRTRLVINGDDPEVRDVLANDPYPERTYTYGRRAGSDVEIVHVRPTGSGIQMTIRFSPRLRALRETRPAPIAPMWTVRSPLLGEHNGDNIAAAALICLIAGCSPGAVRRGVSSFQSPERRQRSYRLRGRYILDDTAMNPASYRSAFETVHSLGWGRGGGRFLLVSAIRGNRGVAVNEQNAAVIAEWAARLPLRRVFLTDSADTVGELDCVRPAEREAVVRVFRDRGLRWDYFPTLMPALAAAWEESRPGDALLLLGAQGMDAGWPLLQRLAGGGVGAPQEPWVKRR